MGEIIITIPKDGNIDLEAVGFEGPDCAEATRAIEEALGIEFEREYKPEFFESDAAVHVTASGS